MVLERRPQKVSMVVAQQIIRDVHTSGMSPGDRLPSERVMLDKYEIGRGTLREALRLLEFRGVIVLKPGPKGGPILLNPSASHLADNLMLLMNLKGSAFRNVIEMRSVLEPEACRLAALKISSEDAAALSSCIDEMREKIESETEFLEANKGFHDVIAWASGNPLLGYFTESLSGIMDATVMGVDYPLRRRKSMLKSLTEIYEAIVNNDSDRSRSLMAKYLNQYISFTEKNYPDMLDRTVQWGD